MSASSWSLGAAVLAYLLYLVAFDSCLAHRASLETLLQYLLRMRNSWGFKPPAPAAGWLENQQATDGLIQDVFSRLKVNIDQRPLPRWSTLRPLRIPLARLLASWRMAHAIERLVWRNAPFPSIQSRLRIAGAELQVLADRGLLARAQATAAGKDIERLLARPQAPVPSSPAGIEQRRLEAYAVLREALYLVHDGRDTLFESLADQQRKASVLAGLGLGLIVLLAVAGQREELFLLGAVGGFLSRLGRLLNRRPVFTDYGASSARLVLAPVSGALAGWIGILLLRVLFDLQVASSTFGNLWQLPSGVDALGVAFVLGFSERLFAKVVGGVEATTSGAAGAAPSPTDGPRKPGAGMPPGHS